MKFIIVPFSELADLLEDTLDIWPLGYRLPEDKKECRAVLSAAAGRLCKNLILQSVKYIRGKPDPLVELLKDLGYPVDVMSTVELDDLTQAADDRYLDLTLAFDVIEQTIAPHLEGKNFEMVIKNEDVLVELGSDLVTKRYRDLARRVKELTPPRITDLDQLDDLEPMARFIEQSVADVFKGVQDEAVRNEMKRIFDLALKRQ